MNIIKCPHNPHHLKIVNYNINQLQSMKLSKLGTTFNVNSNGTIYTIINCGRKVTDADIAKVKQILG